MTAIFLLIAHCSLLVTPSYADICFDADTAGRMVIELEGCRIDRDETIPTMSGMIDSLNIQQALCDQQTALCDEQLKAAQDALSKQETITGIVQPTFWDRVSNFGEDVIITLTVIGGVAAVILLGK